MKKSSILLFVVICSCIVFAQKTPTKKPQPKPAATMGEPSAGKFTGMIFNDFMYVIQEPQTANPTTTTSGRFESIMRRATLGYEYNYSSDITARIVYDASVNILKQGFVDVRNITSMLDLKVGLSQTLSSETVEKIWKYRSLDAAVLDKRGMTQEFDMGMTFTGRFDPQGSTYARLAVYNGTGVNPENDKLKKLAFSVGNWFDKGTVAEVYADFENFSGGRNAITAKAFFGMASSEYGFGGEGFYRINKQLAGAKDVVPAGVSAYGWYDMMKSLRGVARVDVVDNDMNSSVNSYQEIYLNAGVDYAPVPEVHMIPNLVYVKNQKKGTGVEIADYMMLRLTTAIYFK